MTTIELPPETVMTCVCVVMHNILRRQYQGQHGAQQPGGDDDDDDDNVPGDGRLKPCQRSQKTEGLPQGLLQ